MKYCQKCGSTLTDTAKFCPECGTPVKNQDEEIDEIEIKDSHTNIKPVETEPAYKSERSIDPWVIIICVLAIAAIIVWIALGVKLHSLKRTNTESQPVITESTETTVSPASPEPTFLPSPVPTALPTPSPSPSPTPTATAEPAPTPEPAQIPIPVPSGAVVNAIISYMAEPTCDVTMYVGDLDVILTAEPYPSNAQYSSITWSSSDENILSVATNENHEAICTAVGEGNAILTLTIDGAEAKCIFRIHTY